MQEVEIIGTFSAGRPLCCEPSHICPGCRPDVFAQSDGRLNERHLAVRFGDNKPRKIVLLNGRDVSMQAFEIMLGQAGWAYARELHDDGKARIHGCGHREPCAEVLRGAVMVAAR